MYVGVKAVEALENYRLSLTFENDERGVFDMTPYLDIGIFQALRDVRVFQSAHIAFDSVEWNNGADICPEMLYAQSEKTHLTTARADAPTNDVFIPYGALNENMMDAD